MNEHTTYAQALEDMIVSRKIESAQRILNLSDYLIERLGDVQIAVSLDKPGSKLSAVGCATAIADLDALIVEYNSLLPFKAPNSEKLSRTQITSTEAAIHEKKAAQKEFDDSIGRFDVREVK